MKKITLLLAIALASTLQSFGQCATVADVTFTEDTMATTETSITLDFGIITFDDLRVWASTPVAVFRGGTIAVVNTGTSITINGLQPGTTYQFHSRIRCTSPAGDSDGTIMTPDPTAPGNMIPLEVTTAGTAPTTTDAWDYATNPQGQFFTQGATLGIDVTYISEDAPVPVGGITIRLISNAGPAAGDNTIGTYSNTVELPASAAGTATITLASDSPTDWYTTNGVLAASTSIPGDDSNVAGGGSAGSELQGLFPGLPNYFYFVNSLDTPNPAANWTPISVPTGGRFFQIEVDPTLSVSDFTKGDVSSIVTSANPVDSVIELDASGEYSIVNFGGSTVQSGSFSGSINVENLTTGIYFLAIEGGVYKFVKS